jgi:outer membrane protein TolC
MLLSLSLPTASFVLAWIVAAGPMDRLDLPSLLGRAEQRASVQVAAAAADLAHARAQEVDRMWIPRLELSATGGPSPRIRCLPSPQQCIRTVPDTLQLGFEGGFWRLDLRVDMPLYTFGKLQAGKQAAHAAARAGDALAAQSAHAAIFEAAKAYFAVKLGRALVAMLEEGKQKLQQEVNHQEHQLAAAAPEASDTDRRHLLTLLAEVDARLAEARRVMEVGLAGVHYAAQEDDIDVDGRPLRPLAFTLPSRQTVRHQAAGRPEHQAAQAGLEAAHQLVALERAGFYPDLALAGGATLSRSSSVEHPNNAFLVDPYNTTAGALGIVLRWAPELGLRFAKVAAATAEARRAQASVGMARHGLAAEAEKAWAEVHDAQDRLAASQTGERHARIWLTGLAQTDAAGLTELHDLADALQNYFFMRARALQATFDWNVGVMALLKATGQRPQAVLSMLQP